MPGTGCGLAGGTRNKLAPMLQSSLIEKRGKGLPLPRVIKNIQEYKAR